LSTVTDTPHRSPKAEQTRQSIIDAAMQLFRTKGYDKATMRAIADEAGVSIGNAYYYFSSKEHLIQAYYDDIFTDHAEAAAQTLATATTFADRLSGVLLAWIDVAEPYHEFAGKFFKNAAEPSSPL
jgi:AcrR family transcriptional regulator